MVISLPGRRFSINFLQNKNGSASEDVGAVEFKHQRGKSLTTFLFVTLNRIPIVCRIRRFHSQTN